MSRYELTPPSSRYLALFDERKFGELARCRIACEGELAFEIRLKPSEAPVRESDVRLAQEVLGQIVEMDRQARAGMADSDDDYEENLAYVVIGEEIVFYYCANTVNTQWCALFAREEEGKFTFVEFGFA